MTSASSVLIALAGTATFVGLFPCLGWINWFSIPLAFACAIVGTVGLATDKDTYGAPRGVSMHTAAVVIGTILCVVAFIRWCLGGGLL